MNSAIKATFINNSNTKCVPFRASCALLHSTPFLERKRRNFWDSRCNHYSRRFRRMQAKQTLLRNVNAYAEFLFQSWKEDVDEDDPSSSRGPSWFREQYSSKGSARYRSGNQRSRRWFTMDPKFCEGDIDVETIFRFGGNQSFANEENPQGRRSRGYSNDGKSFRWRRWTEYAYESSTGSESDCSYSGSVSDRLALGLDASGPLKLEDVKNAYRACALKWHPDRHLGSSKVIAEEKFKHCSAAYQSLSDKLTLN